MLLRKHYYKNRQHGPRIALFPATLPLETIEKVGAGPTARLLTLKLKKRR
jgi:hypothetical protein